MSHKFFRAPIASYEEANVFLTQLVQVGDGTFLGDPVLPNGTPTRPISAGKVYWPLQYDPEGTGSQVMKETFGCNYLLGNLDPEYPPPADVEEITQQDYVTTRDALFPPPEM